jgi:hypothetical protein
MRGKLSGLGKRCLAVTRVAIAVCAAKALVYRCEHKRPPTLLDRDGGARYDRHIGQAATLLHPGL